MPVSQQLPTTVIVLVTFVGLIVAGIVVAQVAHHVRQRRKRLAMEAARSKLLAQINALKKLRYCMNQQECSCCKKSPREDCKFCLIVKKCDQRVIHPCEGEGDCPGTAHMDCAICLESFLDGDALRLLPCRHIFHVVCADKWLEKQALPGDSDPSCPMCKHVAFRLGGEAEAAEASLAVAMPRPQPQLPQPPQLQPALATPAAVARAAGTSTSQWRPGSSAQHESTHRQLWRARVAVAVAPEPAHANIVSRWHSLPNSSHDHEHAEEEERALHHEHEREELAHPHEHGPLAV